MSTKNSIICLVIFLLCSGVSNASLTANCVPSGLVSWWPGEGDPNDVIGANKGTLMNGASFASGKVGQAFSFDGSSQYLALPGPIVTVLESWTISTWFKTTSGGVIFGMENAEYPSGCSSYDPNIYVGLSGKLYCGVWNSGPSQVISSESVADGQWHHVAMTFHSNIIELYLDGVFVGSTIGPVWQYYTVNQFGTGYTPAWPDANGGWFGFNGLIDEMRLYNHVLTADEVSVLYAAGDSESCQMYSISASVSGGNGTLSCESPVNPGASSTCIISPDSGYHSASLTIDGEPQSVIVSPYTFSNVMASHTITATFEPNDYALTVITAGNGNGSVGGGGTYSYGSSHDVIAIANPGSTFTGWSGDCSGTTSPYSVTMLDRDMTCIATFSENPPDTTITAKPSNPTAAKSASFRFISTKANSTFLCKLDYAQNYEVCVSPKTYTSLNEGAHIFLVKATDSAGNTDTSPAFYTWNIAPSNLLPNLTVSILNMNPLTVLPGSTIHITDLTLNTAISGALPSAPSTTSFYLSTNKTLDSKDINLGSRLVPVLKPGQNDTLTTALTIPTGTALGTYYIIAKADAPNVVGETNETDNISTYLIYVGCDLTVTSLITPVTASSNSKISVSDTIKNGNGMADAPASTTYFYLSTNSTLDASDILLGSRSVPALAAGGVSTGTTSLTLPTIKKMATAYYIIAKADGPSVVAEAIESNNTMSKGIFINPRSK